MTKGRHLTSQTVEDLVYIGCFHPESTPADLSIIQSVAEEFYPKMLVRNRKFLDAIQDQIDSQTNQNQTQGDAKKTSS